jgi:hypothetical protein
VVAIDPGNPATSTSAGAIPARAGIGLRAQHHRRVAETRPTTGWFEAHSENYFGASSAALAALLRVREHYPVALHGVGLSIGSTDPLDRAHLDELTTLVQRVQPGFVSEHLSWGVVDGVRTNDLLPLPYTEEALWYLVARVEEVQEALDRQILIENVSSYLRFAHEEISEWEFLAALARESGCALLLDVNNVYVNARNHGFAAEQFLSGIPRGAVAEIHLAGHSQRTFEGGTVLVDTHSARVAPAVWELFAAAIRRFGPVPTLIEWDADIPSLDVLIDEARLADDVLGGVSAVTA